MRSIGHPSWLSWQRIRLQCRRPQFNSWVEKNHWRKDRLPTLLFLGFPCGSAAKESACHVRDLDSIPGLGRSPGEGKGYAPYSGLENSMDCIVHGITKSQTRLSDLHFTMFLYYYGAILSKFFSLYPYPLSLRIRLNSFFRDLKFSQS